MAEAAGGAKRAASPGSSAAKRNARTAAASKSGRITTSRAGSGGKESKVARPGGGRSGATRTGTPTISTGVVTSADAIAPRAPYATPARPAVPTPAAVSVAQQQLARARRRLDALTRRQQLRLSAISALQDSIRAASVGAHDLPVPDDEPAASAGLSFEQLLLRVFSQHMQLGQLASRPAVEADADTIADTVAELLAALPEFDGPWGPAIGPVYRTDQIRALLGDVSRQALSDRVKRHTLLALKTRDGVTVYPAWQFSEGQVLPGLPEVLKVFVPDEHGEIVDAWTLASWLRTRLDELEGDSVSGRLRAGEHQQALGAARSAAARWSR